MVKQSRRHGPQSHERRKMFNAPPQRTPKGPRKQEPIETLVLDRVPPFEGAVAVVTIINDGDRRERVVVLAEKREDGAWASWGLTPAATNRDGVPRSPAIGLDLVGLLPTYLWGPRLVFTPEDNVHGVIWAAPYELLVACVAQGTTLLSNPDGMAWADATHDAHVAAGWSWPRT